MITIYNFNGLPDRKVAPHKPQPGALEPKRRADGSAVTIANVTNRECRWPCGEAGPAMPMCGRPVVTKPYCKEHHQMVTTGKKLSRL